MSPLSKLSLWVLIMVGFPTYGEIWIGHARKNGKDLYKEETEVLRNDKEVTETRTKYFSPKGELLAELISKFNHGPYLPEIDFNDHRDGYAYTVRYVDPNTLEVREKESSKDPWVVLPKVKVKKDMMVIQSTMAFAKDHLDDIKQGKSVVGSFLIPSSAADYGIQVHRTDSSERTSQIRVESSNWILRNTVFPAFTITYEVQTGRIVRFVGISNIMDELGTIEIVYD